MRRHYKYASGSESREQKVLNGFESFRVDARMHLNGSWKHDANGRFRACGLSCVVPGGKPLLIGEIARLTRGRP